MNRPANQPTESVTIPGMDARTPWQMPWRAWKDVLKRCWTMNYFHNLSLLAAGVAFYGFLAITPLFASVVFIYGLFANTGTVARDMAIIVDLLPMGAAQTIEQQLFSIVTTDKHVTGLALLLSLGFSVYGAMRAAFGLMGALNIIYEENETRSTTRQTATALNLTLAAIGISVVGLSLASTFAVLQNLEPRFGATATGTVIKLLTWLAAMALGCVGFGLLNRISPDRCPARWQWVAPGAALAMVLWLASSFGFSLYVTYISNYSGTYGSLAAIVVALTWLYLGSYAVLLGALLNAEAERQTSCDTTIGPDAPAGSRGAMMADHNLRDILERNGLDKSPERIRRGTHRIIREAMLRTHGKAAEEPGP